MVGPRRTQNITHLTDVAAHAIEDCGQALKD
jgi:hypothetical protein